MNPQTNQKTTKKQPKNQPKINQNGSKISLAGCLGRLLGLLGSSWAHLGAKKPQEPKTHQHYHLWPPPGEPSWDQKFIKNWSGGLPKSDHFFDCLWGRVLLPLGPNLAPTWPPKPSQNRAKLAPRSIKKSIIWVLVGKMSQIAKNPKFADSSTLLIDFWCLGRSTWHPKPTQIRSKSLPKSIKEGIENMMQDGLGFGSLLARIWVDLAAKLGGKLDPSWHQNLENWGPKTMSKKWSKNRVPRKIGNRVPGPKEIPSGSLKPQYQGPRDPRNPHIPYYTPLSCLRARWRILQWIPGNKYEPISP